jgi:hypothetical protein
MKVEHDVYLMLLRAKTLNDIDAWLFAMKDNRDLQIRLIKAVKNRLYTEGTDENGRIIGYYSPLSEKIDPKKITGTHYTLLASGEFYDSIYIGVMNEYFFIDGEMDKMRDQKWFSEGIIGLDENLFDWFSEEIINKYREYADRILFGN